MWGEPIIQRTRGRLPAAAGAAIHASDRAPAVQAADAGAPLPHPRQDSEAETAPPTTSRAVVRPERPAVRDDTRIHRAAAETDVAVPLHDSTVSPSPGRSTPGSGIESGGARGVISPGGPALPVATPIARVALMLGRAEARGAVHIGPRSAAEGELMRRVTPERTGPMKPMQARRPDDGLPVRVSPEISPRYDAVRPSLPLPSELQTSRPAALLPIQQQSSSPPLPMPIQRQRSNQAGGTSSAAALAGAGENQAGSSSAGSQPATPAVPTNEGRVRLDEAEMERVTNAVLQTLKQRLQMEREARGL